MLQQAFNSFIERNNLIPAGKKTLLAVSGGMDSVAMVHLFYLAGKEFGIAHCNFKLRSNDSEKDEAFVKNIANQYSATFYTKSFDTLEQSKKTGDSIQMTARDIRYKWLEKIRKDNNYNLIATAHHHDDNIETLLLNLLRSTGIQGLTGIPVKNQKIIRPLLFATRLEIEKFIKEHRLKYRDDLSNKENKYARNKLRNEVIPVFEQINPSFRNSFSRFFNHITLPYSCYSEYIENAKNKLVSDDDNRCLISINKLKQLQYPDKVLFEILKPFGFNDTAVYDIVSAIDKHAGKKFYGQGYALIKDREYLVLYPENIDNNEIHNIDEEQDKLELPDIKLKINIREINSDFQISPGAKSAYLDMDKLQFPLKLRRWQNGDFFQPLGMKGKKKVSDFLIDQKVSLDKKEKVYVLCSGSDIVWIAGHRIDERYKIDNKTRRCFYIYMI